MKPIPTAVFVIVINGDKVLFVRHEEGSSNPAGTYGLPGGRIEPYESPEETAVRELFEETGLISVPADLTRLGSYSIDIETKNGMEPWTIELYLCSRFEGKVRQREKSGEAVWLSIADVIDGQIPNAANVCRVSFSNNENTARPFTSHMITVADKHAGEASLRRSVV